MTERVEAKAGYTFDSVVRLLISAGTIVGVVWLLRYLSDVLLPFAAAVVLAYLLNPLVTLIERRIRRRGLAVAATLLALGILGLVVLAVGMPLMFGQVSRFREAIVRLHEDLTTSSSPHDRTGLPQPIQPDGSFGDVAGAGGRTKFGWREFKEGWREYRRDAGTMPRSERMARFRGRVAGTFSGELLDGAIAYAKSDEFKQFLVETAKRLAVGGWAALAFTVNIILGLTGLIVVLIYLVFLLLDYPDYERSWPTLLPPTWREPIVDFFVQFNNAMRQYFRGQSLIALLTGTLFAVGFTIIGLPMAVPFGLFVGLLNMVPYLPMVALVPGILLAGLRAVEHDSSFLGAMVLLFLVIAVVQVIQETVLVPRIMGKVTGLRPVAILLGLFIWGKLLGFLGLILAIPLTCLGIAYYRRYVLHQAGPAPLPRT